MAIAGHVSPKMVAHYSHIRIAANRAALDKLARPRLAGSNAGTEQGGNVTNHVTNGTNAQKPPPYVVEKYGRPVRTRTADLYRVKGQLTNTYNNLDGLEGRENTLKYA
jgi:hypothetical protein